MTKVVEGVYYVWDLASPLHSLIKYFKLFPWGEGRGTEQGGTGLPDQPNELLTDHQVISPTLCYYYNTMNETHILTKMDESRRELMSIFTKILFVHYLLHETLTQ